VALVAAAALLITAAPPSDAKPVNQTADVFRLDSGETVGSVDLSRTHNAVHFNLSTSAGGELIILPQVIFTGEHWSPGDATTVWFVVFNHPENCTDGACGEDDVINYFGFGDESVGVGVHYGSGHIAGNNTFHAAGSLKEGTPGDGEPLLDAATAEVHIIVRSHGPAEDLLAEGLLGYSLNSYAGGCADLGAIPNVCGEPQAAIFAPPS